MESAHTRAPAGMLARVEDASEGRQAHDCQVAVATSQGLLPGIALRQQRKDERSWWSRPTADGWCTGQEEPTRQDLTGLPPGMVYPAGAVTPPRCVPL
jgi:hypothetical protein